MKILVTSYCYAPSIGGIETVSKLMVDAFIREGHEVIVVTNTLDMESRSDSKLPIYRRPSPLKVLELTIWADVVWQNNIALTYLWAPLLAGTPVGVTLACAVFPNLPRKRFVEQMKCYALKACHVFSISEYVTEGTNLPHQRIGNPFDDVLFDNSESVEKERDIVFTGRLVSDKGADLLIQSLGALRRKGLTPTCTIIGDGPEISELKKCASTASLSDQIRFTGYLSGATLREEMCKHRIMVVPSRWKEPFGVVALEGIAAGCALVGSSEGGLPEAMGPCGVTFPNGDAEALAETLAKLLLHPREVQKLTNHRDSHLEKFRVKNQSQAYIATFEKLTNSSSLCSHERTF